MPILISWATHTVNFAKLIDSTFTLGPISPKKTQCDNLNADPDKWLMDKILLRAVRLWKGEQVDGSPLQWEIDQRWKDIEPREILSLPTAVMAGWRYLTSLKSTPRYMRAPMHVTLENKSWREFYESGNVWI